MWGEGYDGGIPPESALSPLGGLPNGGKQRHHLSLDGHDGAFGFTMLSL